MIPPNLAHLSCSLVGVCAIFLQSTPEHFQYFRSTRFFLLVANHFLFARHKAVTQSLFITPFSLHQVSDCQMSLPVCWRVLTAGSLCSAPPPFPSKLQTSFRSIYLTPIVPSRDLNCLAGLGLHHMGQKTSPRREECLPILHSQAASIPRHCVCAPSVLVPQDRLQATSYRKISLPSQPLIRFEIPASHRKCARAPAHFVGDVLLRPTHSVLPAPGGLVSVLQEAY